MARDYQYKALYYRETTNGKTKWVKIPGIEAAKPDWRTKLFRLRINTLTWDRPASTRSRLYDLYDERSD